MRDSLLIEPQIKHTLGLAASANIALVGIGVPDSTSFLLAEVLKEKDITADIPGIVGDIGLQFL